MDTGGMRRCSGRGCPILLYVLGMSPAVDCCSTTGRSHHMLERNGWKSSTLSVEGTG